MYYHILAIGFLLLTVRFSIGGQERTKPPQQQVRPLAPEEIFRQSSPSIFVVEVSDEGGSTVALGSGVAVDALAAGGEDSQPAGNLVDRVLEHASSTLIVTNTHVIDPGVSIKVRQGDKSWPAEIEHINLHADLCRLRVNGLKARPVELRSAKTLAVGERVYSLGAPEGLELTMSEGLISGLRDLHGEQVIQTTAAISHGSSGGGLFDSQGRLVGITTFMLAGGQSLNFALLVDTIREPATPRDLDLAQNHAGGGLSYSDAVRIFGKEQIDHDLADVRLFEQVLKRSPDDAHTHAILADRILLLDPHRAIRELDEVLRLNAGNAGDHSNLGTALRKVGDLYGAITELRRSVELDPTSEGAHLALMDALMEDEAPTASVLKEAKVLARLEHKLVLLFFPAARWMIQEGDKDSALAVRNEILNAEDLKSFGHYCLALVQWLGNPQDKEQSLTEFRQAVQLEPKFANFHHALAIALELTDKFDAALQEYKAAAELEASQPMFAADYERALRQSQTQAPAGDRNAAHSFAEFVKRREELEKEIGCDPRVLLKCPNR